MATHNFQIFDESMTDTMTDIDYQTNTQRTNGVIPGVADPLLHNKLYRQCSIMAFAIAQTIVARGYDANDSDPAALANAIQRTFAFSVNGNVPNASGAVTAVRPIDSWPVGSVFLTFQNTNPATLLGGGTWVQIKGKYLLAAEDGDTVDGTTGVGAHTKNVPLVAHTHSFVTESAGGHTHYVSGTTGGAGSHGHSTGSAGNHTHKYLTRNGSGASGAVAEMQTSGGGYDGNMSSAGAHTHSVSTVGNHSHSFGATTGNNGAHTHSGTTASSGTSASFDVRPASVYVYMWRRTA